MKYIFSFLICFVSECIYSETIQNIEYALPKTAEHWVIVNRLDNENGTTLIYAPPGLERHERKEFFGVNANHRPSDPNDLEAIKSALTKIFPKKSVDFRVLEKDKESVMYEWSVQENGLEKVHGCGRAFSNKEGTVILGYHTEDLSKVSQACLLWLPTLKEAKNLSQ